MKLTFNREPLGYYCHQLEYPNVIKLCKPALSRYFDLQDKPESINVLLSLKPSDNSYFIRRVANSSPCKIRIKWSDGKFRTLLIYPSFGEILKTFPNGCYISVIA